MQFTLTIELGNDAIQSAADVATALERVATTLRGRSGREELALLGDPNPIRDINGNTVGTWRCVDAHD